MDDELVIPIRFDIAEEDLVKAQSRLSAALAKAEPGLFSGKSMDFAQRVNTLQQMPMPARAEMLGRNPQLERELDRYNRFAGSGKSDEARAEEGRAAKVAAAQSAADKRQQERADAQAARTAAEGKRAQAAVERQQAQAEKDYRRAELEGKRQDAREGRATHARENVSKRADASAERDYARAEREAKQQDAKEGRAQEKREKAEARKSQQQQREGQSAERDQYLSRTRSLSAAGAFAMGSFGPMRHSLASSVFDFLAGGDPDARAKAQRGRSLGAVVAGASVKTAAASAGGGGLTDSLMGLGGGLASKLFLPAMVAGLALGALNEVDKNRAAMRSAQYGLLANVPGQGTPQQMYKQTLDAAGDFIRDPNYSVQVAAELGRGGVRGSHFQDNLGNALALPRTNPEISQEQSTRLVSDLSSKSRMSADQIGRLFAMLNKQLDATGISTGKMTDAVIAFDQASGGAQLSLKGWASLMGLQGMMGTEVPLTAVTPLTQATGSDAKKIAGALGISEDKLQGLQRDNPAQLVGMVGTFLQQTTKGETGQSRVNTAEIINQGMGFFDTSQMSQQEQTKLMQLLLGGKPSDYAAATALVQDKTKNFTAQDFRNMGKAASGDQTTIVQQDTNAALIAALQKLDTTLGDLSGLVKKAFPNTDPSKGKPVAEPPAAPTPGAGPTPIGTAPVPTRTRVPGEPMPPGTPVAGPVPTGTPVPGSTSVKGAIPEGATVKIQGNGLDTVPQELIPIFNQMSAKYGVPVQDLMAGIARESDFTNSATPDANGSTGLAQFTTDTIKDLTGTWKDSPFYGKTYNPMDPAQALEANAYYIKHLHEQVGGNWQHAYAAYNGGPGGADSQAAQNYANAVIGAAQGIQVEVNGTMVLTDPNGNVIGQGKVSGSATGPSPNAPTSVPTKTPTPGSPPPPPRPAKGATKHPIAESAMPDTSDHPLGSRAHYRS